MLLTRGWMLLIFKVVGLRSRSLTNVGCGEILRFVLSGFYENVSWLTPITAESTEAAAKPSVPSASASAHAKQSTETTKVTAETASEPAGVAPVSAVVGGLGRPPVCRAPTAAAAGSARAAAHTAPHTESQQPQHGPHLSPFTGEFTGVPSPFWHSCKWIYNVLLLRTLCTFSVDCHYLIHICDGTYM